MIYFIVRYINVTINIINIIINVIMKADGFRTEIRCVQSTICLFHLKFIIYGNLFNHFYFEFY